MLIQLDSEFGTLDSNLEITMQIQKFEFEPLVPPKSSAIPDVVLSDVSEAPEPEQLPVELPVRIVEEEIEPVAPVISVEELESAKKQAYEEGFRKGVETEAEKANAEQDALARHIAEILEQIGVQIGLASAHYQQSSIQLTEDMVQIILAIARKVAGHALQQEPKPEVEAVVKEALGLLYKEPHISIAVHPSLKAHIEQKVQQIAAYTGFRGELIVRQLPEDVSLTDCRIEWQDGLLHMDKEVLWQHIENLLEAYGGAKS